MLLLGLTGSIATGKSTVSRLLSSSPYNLPVIDADVLARKVVEPGTPGYRAVVSYFLPTTPDLLLPSGALDRAALGRRVFGSSPERVRDRKVLNGIVHPLVRKETCKAILRAWTSGTWAVVLDVPLLFEAGMEVICGGVIVVAVDEETQLRRLMARDAGAGLTEEDARRRIKSQWSCAGKAELARFVFEKNAWIVDNSGSLEDLQTQVDAVVREAGRERMGLWRWVWGNPPVALLWGVAMVVVRNWWRKRQWDKRRKMEETAKAKL
ncbi:dephospho-CoA kinase-domain-containing protein [Sphaerosporella brunnea]|uniref:Dephospho-CoA kinase-domain-containing protein n=1 Tax=Sphaerosporella brunnea TaxID=1250544 RepID=A0A5J5EQQ5_9PEZI|nr:dephospho-CoA kinase-domain-containing protein [Sphaerosporella brunnea]